MGFWSFEGIFLLISSSVDHLHQILRNTSPGLTPAAVPKTAAALPVLVIKKYLSYSSAFKRKYEQRERAERFGFEGGSGDEGKGRGGGGLVGRANGRGGEDGEW